MTTHFPIIDAHVHVFAPKKYHYADKRSYTPGDANAEKLAAHMKRIGAEKVVIVQPSPYGPDNRATLEAVDILGQQTARAIAVVDPALQNKDYIQSLWAAGVRGLRANLKTSGDTAVEVAKTQLKQLNGQMTGTDMMMQIFLPAHVIIALKDTIAEMGRPTILDHCAGLKLGTDDFENTFEQLLEVLALPNVILKTSGQCRVVDYAANYDLLAPFAPSMLNAAKGRTIWGSDWPHTGKSSERAARPLSEIEPFMNIDDQMSLRYLQDWASNQVEFQAITRDTSLNLFGF
ncbi:MAG: amidohydrolase family protein [Cognatishimia sp.]|uniref:amidohydrolase family protein n=1 Tax=Cognatishimia sp. TaxID=2211648 RepID=UPI003B8C9503